MLLALIENRFLEMLNASVFSLRSAQQVNIIGVKQDLPAVCHVTPESAVLGSAVWPREGLTPLDFVWGCPMIVPEENPCGQFKEYTVYPYRTESTPPPSF